MTAAEKQERDIRAATYAIKTGERPEVVAAKHGVSLRTYERRVRPLVVMLRASAERETIARNGGA